MFDGISTQLLLGQILIGLINGSFYAMLSMGLVIIFGMMHVINFTHGAQYMLGAFCAWLLLNYLGIGYWPSLVLAPLAVALFGIFQCLFNVFAQLKQVLSGHLVQIEGHKFYSVEFSHVKNFGLMHLMPEFSVQFST